MGGATEGGSACVGGATERGCARVGGATEGAYRGPLQVLDGRRMWKRPWCSSPSSVQERVPAPRPLPLPTQLALRHRATAPVDPRRNGGVRAGPLARGWAPQGCRVWKARRGVCGWKPWHRAQGAARGLRPAGWAAPQDTGEAGGAIAGRSLGPVGSRRTLRATQQTAFRMTYETQLPFLRTSCGGGDLEHQQRQPHCTSGGRR